MGCWQTASYMCQCHSKQGPGQLMCMATSPLAMQLKTTHLLLIHQLFSLKVMQHVAADLSLKKSQLIWVCAMLHKLMKTTVTTGVCTMPMHS